jgi:hypothetical protein
LVLKSLFRRSSTTLDVGFGSLNLLLSFRSCLAHGMTAGLDGGLSTRFLGAKNSRSGFPQALLVFGCTGISRGYIGLRSFDSPLGLAPTLGQYLLQWLMDDRRVQTVKNSDQNYGWNGSEQ